MRRNPLTVEHDVEDLCATEETPFRRETFGSH